VDGGLEKQPDFSYGLAVDHSLCHSTPDRTPSVVLQLKIVPFSG
jgi:hypothetical protein